MSRTFYSFKLLLALFIAISVTTGCSMVTVSSISAEEYLQERRDDILTIGELSTSSKNTLRVIGIDDCSKQQSKCRAHVTKASGITEEQRQSVLAELWLEAALAMEKKPSEVQFTNFEDPLTNAWIETARHSWAYLFFTERKVGERALEDRQTQIRDYYNFSVQKAITRIFSTYAHKSIESNIYLSYWNISTNIEDKSTVPKDLVAATSFKFTGLRNIYQRDGFGAPLVATMPDIEKKPSVPYVEMKYPSYTGLLEFNGSSLQEVLQTHDVKIKLLDPYHSNIIKLNNTTVPLAANFTAGYGLWLANSGFAIQSLRTLFGLNHGITRPTVNLMQPYDPNRGIVIMLHGLASSPEAWVNVANEVLGDETLRKNYQIWQIYYPTNAPIILNRHNIEKVIEKTLHQFDASGNAVASKDIVLIGHSMGGVLSRLLVSNSEEKLWELLPHNLKVARSRNQKLDQELKQYMEFKPLPQVTRAIFIASPHRGTPFADKGIARHISNAIHLPQNMFESLGNVASYLTQQKTLDKGKETKIIPNSINNLSEKDPFIIATSKLSINPNVDYHSIIGRSNPKIDLEYSSDSIVPYTSSHLVGAKSELIVHSKHSVQETAPAILEIRRILHEHLIKKNRNQIKSSNN